MSGMDLTPYQEFARDRLGIEFKDIQLLVDALTHRSYINEHRKSASVHNERLEVRVVMATPEGRAVRLTGPTRMRVSRRRLQAGGAADLDRIWAWAVARGYTRETGHHR